MRHLVIILSDPTHEAWAQSLVTVAKPAAHHIFVSTPGQAAERMVRDRINPSHLVLDIGARGQDVLTEIDHLAQQCEPGTRVIAVGNTNDISLYRAIIARGVLDYLPHPANANSVIATLTAPASGAASAAPLSPTVSQRSSGQKRVIVFMSAASGDGASTIALNTAYAISQISNGHTVLVDMDYQFGMVAKQLGLKNQYGIGDLLDHPGRGVDSVLINRMVASYQKLHVITAPPELRYLPSIDTTVIADLISTLSANYDTVIIDLPHVWLPWVTAATSQATQLVLVAQLWLKSVSHAARMMRALRDISTPIERVTAIINRSGAKFKEAIEPKDFERVCGIPIRYAMSNDIRTIVMAEAAATTVMEQAASPLSADINRLAYDLMGMSTPQAVDEKRGGLFSRRKG